MKNLLILLLLTELALLPKQATAANYYFSSTDGDDSRTSAQAQSSSTPWKTIDKLNSFFSSLQPGDVVLFKRGDVFYGSISIKKSGGSGSPISFDAYGSGAKPIITGFTDVTSWSNIGSNLWMSSNSVSSLATLNIVAIRGSFAPIGKWPTNGYNSLTQSGVGTSITHTSLTSSWSGGTVVIRKNHWIIDKSTITSQSGTTINFSNPTPYTASSGWGWFIQNHQSACDVQNEWWYDASSKKIGIYSTATPSRVQVSTIENLLSIDGNSFLSFNDLIFQGSNSTAACPPATQSHVRPETATHTLISKIGATVVVTVHPWPKCGTYREGDERGQHESGGDIGGYVDVTGPPFTDRVGDTIQRLHDRPQSGDSGATTAANSQPMTRRRGNEQSQMLNWLASRRNPPAAPSRSALHTTSGTRPC